MSAHMSASVFAVGVPFAMSIIPLRVFRFAVSIALPDSMVSNAPYRATAEREILFSVCIVMAYAVMAYIVIACIVVAEEPGISRLETN